VHRRLSSAAAPRSGVRPARSPLAGGCVRLEPVDPAAHACDLFGAAHAEAGSEGSERAASLWTYLAYGPFASEAVFARWLSECAASEDPLFFAVRDAASGPVPGRARGMAAFLNIRPADGVLEIGHIWFAPGLQRSRAATEALFLMIRSAFDDLDYRRVEWKCNALNEPSRRAALRLGFRFEGIFHRHMIVKGRNRDTAWYSILGEEWPARRAAFERWLVADNFDLEGRQRRTLAACTAD
jgi:RimJ/RimL family protein N-acetyltransferase